MVFYGVEGTVSGTLERMKQCDQRNSNRWLSVSTANLTRSAALSSCKRSAIGPVQLVEALTHGGARREAPEAREALAYTQARVQGLSVTLLLQCLSVRHTTQ